ncbi:MerR family transcriptional regulator [Antrihabitans sp. NCIMB 15449]|uniref:MerR family transcriptional regulator n=1 Tax=Antrihabitans spumae TaxID=3373370 RepID=A0ABW7JV97_9NOCA
MRINAVEKASGCGRHTIRFYEAEGLIDAPRRDSNNYRDYAPEVVDELAFIRTAQDIGFTPAEIRSIKESQRSSALDCVGGAELVDAKISEITRRITQLRQMKTLLEQMRADLVVSAVQHQLDVPVRLQRYGQAAGVTVTA